MDDRWVVLYKKLEKIEEEFLSAQNRNDLMPIRENLSEIQEFAVWFMKEKYVIDGKNWEEQQKKLLDILQDIVIAIEQQDCVRHGERLPGRSILHRNVRKPFSQ